jgi:hypothetical protein
MKHKVLSKVALCGMLLLPFASAAVVQAAGTWTVSVEELKPYGGWSTWGNPNVKQTQSSYASFNGDVVPSRKHPIKVRLINNKAKGRSSYVELVRNKTKRANDNTGLRDRKYWGDARTDKRDSHSARVKFHFSADYK